MLLIYFKLKKEKVLKNLGNILKVVSKVLYVSDVSEIW